MTDQYVVIGNPIAFSLSPTIHQLFAKQTHQDLAYTAILAEVDQFEYCVKQLQQQGYKGANVTLPFKEKAYRLVNYHTDRATLAKAVNTLIFHADGSITGDNTDGVGLISDFKHHLNINIKNQQILILGAGGAARGIIPALLKEQPATITIINRTKQRAIDLATDFSKLGNINIRDWNENNNVTYDIIINATSLSLQQKEPQFPHCKLSATGGCYDLAYGKQPNAFLTWGENLGAKWTADGLGMLVEQAAEAFFIWRGIRPDTLPVLQYLATLI